MPQEGLGETVTNFDHTSARRSDLRLAHYAREGQVRVGLVDRGTVYDLEPGMVASNASGPWTIDTILAEGLLPSVSQEATKIVAGENRLPLNSVKLHSPILNPEKILLMAVNYRSHSKEISVKDAPPAEPYLFTKFRNTLIGPGDPVLIPSLSHEVDWEVELAVIIGKTGRDIAKKNALNYVAGYAVSNDISFRDLQFSTRLSDGATKLGLNWVKGKGLDASFPLGPWLVTADEITNPQDLPISLSVNGKTRQQSTTGDMIFTVDSIIEYLSQGMTLRPGDIISTGTPEGVGAFTGGPYLKNGDILEAKIEKIGTLRNPVQAY